MFLSKMTLDWGNITAGSCWKETWAGCGGGISEKATKSQKDKTPKKTF